jgi:hypothetical protein
MREVIMKSYRINQNQGYRITIEEKLDASIAQRFSDLIITSYKDGKTILAGPFVDQAALRGLIDYLWNINITILSVDRIENE